MQKFLLVIFLGLLLFINEAYSTGYMSFDEYKIVYEKSYSEDEHHIRKVIYEENLKTIISYNNWAEKNGYDSRLGVNAYCDRHPREFGNQSTLENIFEMFESKIVELEVEETSSRRFKRATPSSWDWRNVANRVKPIEDQGSCKADWAFSVKSALETIYAIKYNTAVSFFSSQQILDCTAYTSGCQGGSIITAALFAQRNGLVSYYNYRYDGKVNPYCSYYSGGIKPSKLTLLIGTLSGLKTKISTTGPVVINLLASYNFLLYQSGIFYDQCDPPNQPQGLYSLVIIGYGTASNTDYWILRNSMGSTWGESGYMRLPVRSDNTYCGRKLMPLYMQF